MHKVVSIVYDDKSNKVTYQDYNIPQPKEILTNIELDDPHFLFNPNHIVELDDDELQNLKHQVERRRKKKGRRMRRKSMMIKMKMKKKKRIRMMMLIVIAMIINDGHICYLRNKMYYHLNIHLKIYYTCT